MIKYKINFKKKLFKSYTKNNRFSDICLNSSAVTRCGPIDEDEFFNENLSSDGVIITYEKIRKLLIILVK